MCILFQLTHTHTHTHAKASVFHNSIETFFPMAMAPHSSTLAWKVPWTEEPDGLQSMGSLESDKTERLHFHFSL